MEVITPWEGTREGVLIAISWDVPYIALQLASGSRDMAMSQNVGPFFPPKMVGE